MRFFYCFLLVSIIFFESFSQEKDRKVFAFSEVATIDSAESDLLFKRAKTWLKQNKFKLIDSTAQSLLKAENELFVYQKGIASKKLHGKISYSLLIELKDHKYRYTFSDFVFHYYKQNRNYEMVPTKKQKSLNDEKASGWQNLWERHKKTTVTHTESLISSLKDFMKTCLVNKSFESKAKEEDF